MCDKLHLWSLDQLKDGLCKGTASSFVLLDSQMDSFGIEHHHCPTNGSRKEARRPPKILLYAWLAVFRRFSKTRRILRPNGLYIYWCLPFKNSVDGWVNMPVSRNTAIPTDRNGNPVRKSEKRPNVDSAPFVGPFTVAEFVSQFQVAIVTASTALAAALQSIVLDSSAGS